MQQHLLEISNDELESNRIEQVQLNTFLTVFSNDEDNYMEINDDGFLSIKNMKDQRNIVFKSLQLKKLPKDQKVAFVSVIETQKQGLPEEFGGTIKSTI
jgi:hypothetical protein